MSLVFLFASIFFFHTRLACYLLRSFYWQVSVLGIVIERLNIQHVFDVARVLFIEHFGTIVVTLDRVLLHGHASHHGYLFSALDACIDLHSLASGQILLGGSAARTHFTLSIAQVMRHCLKGRSQLH